MVPCQLLFDPSSSCQSHLAPSRFVVDQVDQQLCQLLRRRSGLRRPRRRQPRSGSRAGRRRRRVVRRPCTPSSCSSWRHRSTGFLGSGRDTHVGGGEDRGHVGIGDASGERDEVGQVETVAQRDEIVEAVARSDEGEADVAPPELVHDVSRPAPRRGPRHPVAPSHPDRRPDGVWSRRSSGFAEVRRSRVRSGPVRTTVTTLGRCRPARGRSAGRSRWWR